jgi:hypothetical protein
MHAAVLAAVKARPLGVRASGMHCVPAGLDGVCARAAAVIRGRGGGRACGAVEQRKGRKRVDVVLFGAISRGLAWRARVIDLERDRVGEDRAQAQV